MEPDISSQIEPDLVEVRSLNLIMLARYVTIA
jgi:hypothetical protein